MGDYIFDNYKKLENASTNSRGLLKKVNSFRLKIFVSDHVWYLLQKTINLSAREYQNVCLWSNMAEKSKLVKVFSKRNKFLK